MINRLKKKIIILSTVGALVLMTMLVAIMNIINYTTVVAESDSVIDTVSQPNAPFFKDKKPPKMDMKEFLPRGMSPEVPYESRFFMVNVNEDGEILESELSRIISVDTDMAQEYITEAMATDRERGFIDNFRFVKTKDERGTRITFLDCGRKLNAFYNFMWTSIAIGILGCVIVFVFFVLASEKIVKPISDSYERQKRFITDAGHEIKTPLTIINANVDLIESENGENECIEDIRLQTRRLTGLTNDLVYLSRMDESGIEIPKEEFSVTETVKETAQSFNAPAVAKKLEYRTDIQDGISMKGYPEAMRHLTSVLLDNAVKYTQFGGTVRLSLKQDKKQIILSVYNTVEIPVTREMMPHLFERFYRTDASRNSETGGHGLGLSIAQAIVENHKGKISAATSDGSDIKITAEFPA
ncbi:MAG: HAMP domain-containing sensor histidine kinase [Lachnospiraceae bacterium]|nr:HAMP domain-containing sensor histidine kinase [Lachnospiraceae bacterium]